MPRLLDKDQVRREAPRTAFAAETHARQLAEQLSDGMALMAYLGELQTRMEGFKTLIANTDFASEEGRLRAIENQGHMKALNIAIELLLEMATEPATEEEQDNG